jgi:ribosome-binding factor A
VVVSGHRVERVADHVRRVLAHAIREKLRDRRVGVVTVTEVRLTPDLRQATVYVTLGEGSDRDEALIGLRRATPFLRHELAREAALRFTPELVFAYDESVDRGQRVEDLLRRIEEERRAGADGEPDPSREGS